MAGSRGTLKCRGVSVLPHGPRVGSEPSPKLHFLGFPPRPVSPGIQVRTGPSHRSQPLPSPSSALTPESGSRKSLGREGEVSASAPLGPGVPALPPRLALGPWDLGLARVGSLESADQDSLGREAAGAGLQGRPEKPGDVGVSLARPRQGWHPGPAGAGVILGHSGPGSPRPGLGAWTDYPGAEVLVGQPGERESWASLGQGLLRSYPQRSTGKTGLAWDRETPEWGISGQAWTGTRQGLPHTAARGSRSRRLSPGRRKALDPRRRFIASCSAAAL